MIKQMLIETVTASLYLERAEVILIKEEDND